MVIALAISCTTVPVTERRQLTLLPDLQLVQLSVDNYGKVLHEAKLSQDQAKIDLVNRVGTRLAGATEEYLRAHGYSTQYYQWEFSVIDDDETINAWCMPGGKVAVYTGILPITQNEDGLAVVMAHEIAHAVARHGNERMTQTLLLELGEVALSKAMQDRPQRTQDIFRQSYGAASSLGVLLPYSRMHESEADRIGLTLMAMAGYDPRAAIPFWERMNKAGSGRVPQFLSTHPAPQSRIQNIQYYLPEAMAAYRPR